MYVIAIFDGKRKETRTQGTNDRQKTQHHSAAPKEYDIQSAEDIQDALKDLLGGTIKEMMEAELEEHLGYEKSQRSDSDDSRNSYKQKQINSNYAAWTTRCHRTVSLPLSRGWSENGRRISLKLTKRLSPWYAYYPSDRLRHDYQTDFRNPGGYLWF